MFTIFGEVHLVCTVDPSPQRYSLIEELFLQNIMKSQVFKGKALFWVYIVYVDVENAHRRDNCRTLDSSDVTFLTIFCICQHKKLRGAIVPGDWALGWPQYCALLIFVTAVMCGM